MIKSEAERKKLNEPFTREVLKRIFNEEFKRIEKGKNVFFDSYDEFYNYKLSALHWTKGTAKRYKNIRSLLERFEITK